MITALSILTGVLVAALFFRLFFDGFGDFFECVGYIFTPDILSLFRGEWAEDQWASLKLFIYFGLSVGSGYLAYYQLHEHFG